MIGGPEGNPQRAGFVVGRGRGMGRAVHNGFIPAATKSPRAVSRFL